jgi:hypothetical protein
MGRRMMEMTIQDIRREFIRLIEELVITAVEVNGHVTFVLYGRSKGLKTLTVDEVRDMWDIIICS